MSAPAPTIPIIYGYSMGLRSEDGLAVIIVFLGVVYLVCGLEDAWIDLIAFARNLHPQELGQRLLTQILSLKPRKIAIIVPAWKESGVIGRMLQGNAQRIQYRNYFFFVGVYPNDPATVQEVTHLSLRMPWVRPVINAKPGPTSKGQMLNQIIQGVLRFEKEHDIRFDAFLMQDAEDVIHPLTLPVINWKISDYDFVQVPVFSLSVGRGQLVASTYMDEFAESHTKELLVRESLGAALPSAGVGTALSRHLVMALLRARGAVFNEASLTEDYELGVTSHGLRYRSLFACYFYRTEAGRREFIATREYFPRTFRRSLRQKARWTTGIAFQGTRNLGWSGNLANRFFLYRDRKGPYANLAAFLGYPCVLIATAHPVSVEIIWDWSLGSWLLGLNLFLMFNRYCQRMVCVARVYGVTAALPVIIAWPIGNTINALAGILAMQSDLKAALTRTQVKWVKTEHELPEFFGKTAAVIPTELSLDRITRKTEKEFEP